jgi:phytanoyl-CoA hydroxylase
MLTDKQIASYWENGFVVLGRILDDSDLEALRAEEGRFRGCVQYSLADGKTVLPDKTSTIFRNQLANYSEPLRGIYLRGLHIAAMRQIIGPTVCGFFNQFVTKLPDANLKTAEFPWHQDNGYGGNDVKTNVTVWTALDDVDERNGCVWVVPGSHKLGLLDHKSTGTSWHLTVKAPNDGIPVPLKAGEAVAFSGLTLHRSLANHTGKPRRAFFMQYGDYAESARLEGKVGLVTTPLYLVCGSLPYPIPEGTSTP